MQETHSNKHPNDFDDEIDLRELFYVLLEGKWIIVSLTAFVSIIGVIYSLSLPNIYQSNTILVSVNSSNGISGALRSYSGLAGLAGISLPSGGGDGNMGPVSLEKAGCSSTSTNPVSTALLSFLSFLFVLSFRRPL